MSKLVRRLVIKGEMYSIEYAVRSDGTSPVKSFMDLLKEGMWRDDPSTDEFPSDEQISDWGKFLDRMKQLANYGEPLRKSDINFLEDGLWEFKAWDKRITFFDTPGDGTFSPKNKIIDKAESPFPDSDFWWIPQFDEFLRLANFWPKVGDTADPLDIAEGLKIRDEDVTHDQ